MAVSVCTSPVFTAYSCLAPPLHTGHDTTRLVRVWCLDHLHSGNSATDPWAHYGPIRGQGCWERPMRSQVSVSLEERVSGYRQAPVAPISAISLPSPQHCNLDIWRVWPRFIVGQKIVSIPVCFFFKINVESWSIPRKKGTHILRRYPERSSKLWAKN